MRHILLCAAFVMAGLALATPSSARVHEESATGFVIRLSVDVKETPETSWDMLVRPSKWWSATHTFSKDAQNLSLHPRAGGCFCEILPDLKSPSAAPRGSVEHMRVIFAEDARALRLIGALGPMQSEAVTGVLTIVLKPIAGGTRILWEYVVSGKLRKKGMAGAVDRALAEQILRLADRLGAGKVSSWTEDDLSPGGQDVVVEDKLSEDGPTLPDADKAADPIPGR
ncbi:MAG: SRPBCC family protein [Novosphingobium sp.]|nr:SRPBCC family protein [Novosphingobium sp.]